MAKNFNVMSKNELVNILADNLGSLKNTAKNGRLKDRVSYAGVHDSTKSDLLSLVKEVANYLGDSLVIPAVAEEKKETSKPKLSKKGSTKSENLTKAKPQTKKTEPKAEPKTEAKKESKPKSKTPAKGAKKDLEDAIAIKGGIQLLEEFPDEVTFDKRKYIKSDISSMEEFHEAVEENRDIIVAFYFPKRNLKQFGYFNGILGRINEFKNDLDFCQPLYVSDENTIAYLISLYTEASFYMLPYDFEPIDGIKIAGCTEFEIYEAK